ncbi:hypothetical protein [Brevibacterium album]|uniref:hypothetical protein n=1 Tax=Brevibacterium album TaxID=417948 RepID=UPI0012EBD202|nr:hypothetical protein [Brevibacterium album]
MRSRFTRLAAMPLVAGLALAGCSKADGGGGDSAGGEGVEAGATMEEYQAAFEEVEPIELNFQVASPNPEAAASLRDRQLAESLEEWSGGKITVNIHYAGAVAAPTEVPAALVDGRLDMAHYYTTYEPQEMPGFVDMTTSMVQVPSTPLVGEIVTHAALQEVSFGTPEIMEEFASRGLHVINPANPGGNISMVCADERASAEDFSGAQIRGNAASHKTEVEALGGTITSIELAEGYEAFQRGILDCSLQSPATALAVGWLEVAPNVYFPQEQSFAPGPGSLVAGSSWEQLPLVAQQLIFDRQREYTSAEFFNALEAVRETSDAATAAGGSAQYLDAESEAALTGANETLLAGLEDSENLDGAALNAAVKESIDKWTAVSEELGYTDDGGFEDFSSWYQGSEDFEDREYLQAISDRMFEEIILPQRPS